MSEATHVTVLDTEGNPHEVTRRNATDLVTHLGWKYQKANDFKIDQQAHAPRNVKSREDRKKELEDKMSSDAQLVEDAKPSKKKRSEPKKAKVSDPILGEEEVIPFDARDDIDAELAEIDAEIVAENEGKE